MGLTPNPEGKQTRHPFNCLGKKISMTMALSQGHAVLHGDNSQIWYCQQGKNCIHSVKIFHTVQQLATQSNSPEETVHWISLHFNCEAVASLVQENLMNRNVENWHVGRKLPATFGSDGVRVRHLWLTVPSFKNYSLFCCVFCCSEGCFEDGGVKHWSIGSAQSVVLVMMTFSFRKHL